MFDLALWTSGAWTRRWVDAVFGRSGGSRAEEKVRRRAWQRIIALAILAIRRLSLSRPRILSKLELLFSSVVFIQPTYYPNTSITTFASPNYSQAYPARPVH